MEVDWISVVSLGIAAAAFFASRKDRGADERAQLVSRVDALEKANVVTMTRDERARLEERIQALEQANAVSLVLRKELEKDIDRLEDTVKIPLGRLTEETAALLRLVKQRQLGPGDERDR